MINRSVAGVVCPVAGVILTADEENYPVAVVACPVARVIQNCVAQVTSKSTVGWVHMKQTVVWGSVARDSSLIHEITQLQYAHCMKHTVVSWPFSLGHAYIQ